MTQRKYMKVNENKEIGIKYDSEKPDYSLIPPLPLEDIVNNIGIKYDSKKPRLGLLPPKAIYSISKVLTYGAQKYKQDDNWKHLSNGKKRYIDASLRHIFSYIDGDILDIETNESHLSHAICCLMFILEQDLNGIDFPQ